MRVAFIRPGMSGRKPHDALQPLVFSIIRALTPDGIHLEFHDGGVESVPTDLDVDAVAMSVETFTARSAYAIAEHYRARGIPVIMGGFHPSMVPDEASEHADAIVVGDAEDTWPVLLADLAAGVLKARYQSGQVVDMAVPRPGESVIDKRKYPPLGLLQFSRGCRWACDFCSVHAFYGSHIRTMSLPDIVQQVGGHSEPFLFFTDDNLFADRERARALFEALVPLKKRWVCQISMDVADDPGLLRLMRRAGCVMVLIGFESLNLDNLRRMGKGANLAMGDYERVIKRIRAAGLMIYGTFVIGYDHDTPETADQLVAFAKAHRFSVANFNPLMPMPGTKLYERLSAEGRLLHDRWWLDQSFRYGDAMFTPAQMSADELADSCKRARFAFYSLAAIAARTMDASANAHGLSNLVLHLSANLISRAEIHAKQGRPLGVAR